MKLMKKLLLSTLFLFNTNITAEDFYKLVDVEVPKIITLKEAINLALQNNSELQIKTQDLKLAESKAMMAQSKILPKLGLKASSAHELKSMPVDQTNIGVALTVPLFDVKNLVQIKAAKDELESAKNKLNYEKENLILSISSLYIDALMAQSVRDVAKEEQERFARELVLLQKQASVGSARNLDVLRGEYLLNQSNSDFELKVWEFEKKLGDLGHALSINNYFLITAFSINSEFLNKNSDDLVILAKSSQEISMLKKKVDSANLMLTSEYLSFLPTLNATASSGWQFLLDDKAILGRGTFGSRVMFNLELPLFLGGSRLASIKSEQANKTKAHLELEQKEQAVLINIAGLIDFKQKLERAQKSAVLALNSAQKTSDSATRLYKLSEATQLEVVEANLNLVKSQNNLAAATFKLELVKIKLLFAIGKISEILQQ